MYENDGGKRGASFSISFAGILTIVFIILKLCHVIDWSWWWVLSPLWISAAITLFFIMIFFLVVAIIKKKE